VSQTFYVIAKPDKTMTEKPTYQELQKRIQELEQELINAENCKNFNRDENLIRNEALFRGLFDNMTSGCAIYEVINDGSRGSDYIIRGFNKTSLMLEKKTIEQVIGKSLFDLRPNIDYYGLINVMKKVWKTGKPAYFPIKIYEDENFSNYYENYIFKIPSGKVVTIYNDVTEQKNAEIALKESEERFGLAMKFANDGLFDWNLETNEIYYSPTWKSLLGYAYDEIKNEFCEWERLTKPEHVDASWAMLKEVLDGKRDHFRMEFKMRHKDGHWVDILSRANVVFNEEGKGVRLVGTHVDITERKKVEKTLNEYKLFLDQISDVAYTTDANGNVTYANPAAAKFTGRPVPNIIGKSFITLFVETDHPSIIDVYNRALSGESLENTLTFKTGVTCHFSILPKKNSLGKIIGTFGIGRNIEELLRYQKALEESEERLKESQHFAKIGSWDMNAQTGDGYWSDELFRLLGYEPNEKRASYALFRQHLHPEDVSKFEKSITEYTRRVRQVNEFLRFITTKGESRFAQSIGNIEFDAKGNPIRVYGTFQDITEQKEAEEALRESEQILAQIVMGSPVPTFVIDKNHRTTHWNKALEDTTGIKGNEIIGTKKQWKAFYSIERPTMADLIVDSATEDEILSYYGNKILKSTGIVNAIAAEDYFSEMSGEGRWLFFTAAPLMNSAGETSGAVETLQDITDRKLVEQSLRENEERYRTLFEAANDAIIVIKDGRYYDCNPKAMELFKCTSEKIIGKFPFELSPDYQSDGFLSKNKALDLMNKALGGKVQIFKWQHLSYDGSPFDAEVNLTRLALDGENCLLAIVRDITERKLAEEAIRKSDERLKIALDVVSDAVWDWRVDTGEVYFSARWYTMLGYEPYELPQEYETWKKLLHPEDRSSTEQTVLKHVQSGEPFELEFRMRTKDNQWRWILARGKMVEQDAKGSSSRMLGTHMDITDRKFIEARMQQAQKMEAIGTLAGGIAHDFNNILGGIFGYAQLAQMSLKDNPKVKKYIDQLCVASERAKGLVQQILAFSRQSKSEKVPTDIGLIVKEALKLLRASIPTTIEIEHNVEADIGTVEADPNQIHQIVMNLCTNAFHAIRPERGKINVDVAKLKIVTHDTAYPNLEPGMYLKLSVADSGQGMDDETITRIFEPYFTTKDKGEGTGMGLAVVHGIAKDHGGDVKVFSQPGEGSTFEIILPMIEEEHIAETAEPAQLFHTGHETILLVDDEEILIEIGKDILERLGYRVITYTSSSKALEDFKAQPGNYDIVITDMTMPKMTGDKLAHEIKKIRKDIPIILCTGFSENISQYDARKMDISECLMKPVTVEALAKTVRSTLDNSKPK
jgi:PAS domain S-box-containing protein